MAARQQLKRYNMNLPEELIKKVDDYAEELCIARTTAVTILLNAGLTQQKGVNVLDEMLKIMKEEKTKIEKGE